jgi:hypothetical protein
MNAENYKNQNLQVIDGNRSVPELLQNFIQEFKA